MEPIHPKVSATLAGGSLAGAITIIIVYGLSLAHIAIPDDVAQAFTIILGTVFGLVAGYVTPSPKAAPPAQGT